MNTDFPYVIISVKPKEGYIFNFSQEIDSHTKEAIRVGWSPQGSDWANFIGINIVRIISLPNKQKGWVEIKVTADKDEFERLGLLWCKVTIVPENSLEQLANNYISNLPASVRSRSKHFIPNKLWLSWRAFWGLSTLFTSMTFMQDWELIEAIVIRSYLALSARRQRFATISTVVLSDKENDNKIGTLAGIPNEYLRHKKANVIIDTKTG